MKRNKIFVTIIALLLLVASFAACDQTHDHIYGSWELTETPTLTVGGKASHTCSVGNESEEVDIPALNDSEVWTATVTEATCLAAGKTVYTSVYGTVEVAIEQLAHNYGAWTITTEPTLTAGGKASHTCSVSEEVEEVDIPALSNATVWTPSTTDATCTVAGETTYSSVYGTVVVNGETLPHQYGAWTITTEPTLTAGGKASHVCSECNESEEVDIPALNDATVWTATVTEATCLAAGKTVYTSVYGTIELAIEQLSHEYGSWTITTEPTLTAGGKASHICSECNESEEVDIPALNDATVWTATVTEATCLAAGKTTYSSVYGTVEVAIDQLSHNYGSWTITTEPTLTATGKASHVCSVGEEVEEVDIPALNDAVWTASTTSATCTVAGKTTYSSVYGTVEVAIDQLSHEYGSWTITTEPALTAGGKASHTCSVGGETEEVDIPALNDSEVWTATVTEATCLAAGKTVYTSVYGTVEVAIEQLSHEYGAWTITTEPTLTAAGKASHVCSVGEEVEEVDIPALNDATVWTATVTAATCLAAGKTVYTSVYGTIELPIEQLSHEYGSWTITTEPTLTEGGKASHTCSECNESEEIDIPALNDATVWASETTDATYNAAGKTVYTSDYGTVEVAIAKLVAPYDNKTYYGFFLYSNGYSNRVVNMENTWIESCITVDANGISMFTADLITRQWAIEMVNPETGEITITSRNVSISESGNVIYGRPTLNKGYVDMNTGVIVRTNGGTFAYVHVMIPRDEPVASGTVTASAWDKAMAITYAGFTTTYNMFIYDEVVYFGVSFTSPGDSTSLDAAVCYNADGVYVETSEQSRFGFGHNGEKLVLLDTLEGTYANDDSEDLVLSGFGTVTYQGNNGTYTIAADDATYDLDMYVNNGYYHVTLSSNYTYTLVQPEVTVSFDAGNYATVDAVDVNMNIAYTLPTPYNVAYTFKGWYYDEEYTQPVENFVPTADITLYALWEAKLVVQLVGVIGEDPTTLYLGEDDVLADLLPTYTIDTVARKVFRGWYLSTDATQTLLSIEGYAPTENVTLVAKWDLMVTITVVYGKGLANDVTNYGEGDTIVLTKPEMTGGQIFEGWYTDAAFNTPYVEGEASETMTIYCKWKDPIALYGEYAGFETLGGTGSTGGQQGTNNIKFPWFLSIDAYGNVTGTVHSGTITDYNSTTGVFHLVKGDRTYYGYYDPIWKVVAINGSYNVENLGYDLGLFFESAETALTSSDAGSHWNGGRTRLLTASLTGIQYSTLNIFLYNGVAYCNVSWTSTDATLPTAGTAYSANQLTILDSRGRVIVEFVRGTRGLEEKTS